MLSWFLSLFRRRDGLHLARPRWEDGSPRPRITSDRSTTAALLKALKAGQSQRVIKAETER